METLPAGIDVPAIMNDPKPAKFAGVCGGCKARIQLKEPIVWTKRIGTRCQTCCIEIWGSQARVKFSVPPITMYEHQPTLPTLPDPTPRQPRQGIRTYEELFPEDS